MRHFALAGDAFKQCFRAWRPWLIQFLVNPVLFAGFLGWLLLPVSNTGHVILNATVALILISVALILHGGTLNYFYLRSDTEAVHLRDIFGRALRHLLALAVCVVVVYFLWLLADKADNYQQTLPAYVRSTMPVFVRRIASETFFNDVFAGILFALRWILIPGLILPFIASTSCLGFRGFARKGLVAWKNTVLSLSYWVILIVAALIGVLATQKLMGMTPDFRTSTFSEETTSLVVRLFFAYLLGLLAWMLTCSVVGCGNRQVKRAPEGVSGQAAA